MQFQNEIRRRQDGINIPRTERIASVAVGTSAIVIGLRRGSALGWLLAIGGAALTARGLSGRSAVYRSFQRKGGIEARASITVGKPRAEVYRFWRRLDNLPRFMAHLKQVTMEDDRTSRWVVEEGPLHLTWVAEITEDLADRRISWRSVPDSDVINAGIVELQDAPGGRGTEIHVAIRYRPPGGALVVAPLRGLLRRVTSLKLEAELRRMRQLLETGELATGAPRAQALDETERKAKEIEAVAPPMPVSLEPAGAGYKGGQ